MDISFRLTAPLQLPNRKPNLRWQAKGAITKKARELLAWEIMAALAGQIPAETFKFSSVRIFRHCVGEGPDVDNLYASAKDILDVLQPPTARRTFGLGIISDDKPSRCDFVIQHVRARHRPDQCTRVVIRMLEAMPALLAEAAE